MLLPAVYNTILSPLVLPPITRLLRARPGTGRGLDL